MIASHQCAGLPGSLKTWIILHRTTVAVASNLPRQLAFLYFLGFTPQIIRTIKAGEPEVLEYTDIKPEDASHLVNSLRHPSDHLETYRHRYVVPFQRWC